MTKIKETVKPKEPVKKVKEEKGKKKK